MLLMKDRSFLFELEAYLIYVKVEEYIFWSFGITEFINRVAINSVLGAWPLLHISLLLMIRLSKTEFAFHFFDVVLAFK